MTLEELYTIIKNRRIEKREGSYVSNLIAQGADRVVQKIGEEAVEVVIAAKNSDKKLLQYEIADLMFHILVLMQSRDITLNDIYHELETRNNKP